MWERSKSALALRILNKNLNEKNEAEEFTTEGWQSHQRGPNLMECRVWFLLTLMLVCFPLERMKIQSF